jgi:hypothetical protein
VRYSNCLPALTEGRTRKKERKKERKNENYQKQHLKKLEISNLKNHKNH